MRSIVDYDLNSKYAICFFLISTLIISSAFVIFGSTVTQEYIMSAISIAAATAPSTLPATLSPVRVPAAIA